MCCALRSVLRPPSRRQQHALFFKNVCPDHKKSVWSLRSSLLCPLPYGNTRIEAMLTIVYNCARYLVELPSALVDKIFLHGRVMLDWAIGRSYRCASSVGVWKGESILNAGETQRMAVGVKRWGDVRIFVIPTTGTSAKDLVGHSTRFALSRRPPDGVHATVIHGISVPSMMGDRKDDPRPSGVRAACRRSEWGLGQEWPGPEPVMLFGSTQSHITTAAAARRNLR